MNYRIKKFAMIIAVSVLAVGPVYADKPDSPGNSGAKNTSEKSSKSAAIQQNSNDSQNFFTSDRRIILRDYYSTTQKSGKCPPGLAKKNNGCMPPGQLKKWQKGEVLPRDVVYNDLPRAILDQLGRTPEGEKIVQVGTDLLLISIGTGIILDVFNAQE